MLLPGPNRPFPRAKKFYLLQGPPDSIIARAANGSKPRWSPGSMHLVYGTYMS